MELLPVWGFNVGVIYNHRVYTTKRGIWKGRVVYLSKYELRKFWLVFFIWQQWLLFVGIAATVFAESFLWLGTQKISQFYLRSLDLMPHRTSK